MTITVRADPKGQGNHSISRAGVIYESTKGHRYWRDAVTLTARQAISDYHLARRGEPFTVPVGVKIYFTLAKPKSVRRSLPCHKPDLDKLIRSTLDALTKAGVWTDDGLVCHLESSKAYANRFVGLGEPGAIIIINSL